MARAPDYDLVVRGGNCLYTGCVPSKALQASASLAQSMREADRLGLETSEPAIDLRALMDRFGAVIEAASGPDSPDRLRAAEVEVVEQAERFLDPATVETGIYPSSGSPSSGVEASACSRRGIRPAPRAA